jgi:cyanophycinase
MKSGPAQWFTCGPDRTIIHGHPGEVVGHGSVTFVEGRGVRFDHAVACMEGGALTLSYLRVGIVGAGYTFNLRERELETLVQMRSPPSPTEVLRGDGAAG